MAIIQTKRTRSFLVGGLSLVLTGLMAMAAAPAFAGDADSGDKAAHAFPMKADAFQQKVEARLAHRKALIEQRITEAKVDETKAKEMRARYDEHVTKVRAALATVVADGVVTKEEAQTVREASGHHGHPRAKRTPKS